MRVIKTFTISFTIGGDARSAHFVCEGCSAIHRMARFAPTSSDRRMCPCEDWAAFVKIAAVALGPRDSRGCHRQESDTKYSPNVRQITNMIVVPARS
jgi:hypothetical protein